MAARFSGPGLPYHNVIRNGHWNGSVELSKKHLLDPLKWKPGRPIYDAATGKEVGCDATQSRRIFVNSMSDLFHPNVPDEWIDRIFAVMALCPQHIFQVLTKRPERMLEYLSGAAWQRCCKSAGPYEMEKSIPLEKYADRSHILDGHGNLISVFSRWPLPNVWLGVSIENQDAADERIPLLLQTPAAVRFVSCEPMLGSCSIEMSLR
jgi:protein gp37